MTPALQSVLTCPACGATAEDTMPTNACVHSYTYRSCGTRITPKSGDCRVFCSYGSVPCPPVQIQSDSR